MSTGQVWVCGEVLIDLIPDAKERKAVVGGGPANTAKALAKLGIATQFIDGISSDQYGQMALKELQQDGVLLDYVNSSNKPTALAIISLSNAGAATYEFVINETATFDFSHSWLPDPFKLKPALLHIGTLVTAIEPAASILHEWASQVAEVAPVVFDPNIRPAVMGNRDLYVAAVEKWVAISACVKVSDDDLSWLYPDEKIESVVNRWLSDGVALVVVTYGAKGITGYTSSGSVAVDAVKVAVVDTVGAGDTVGAVLVESIIEKGLSNLTGDLLRDSLARAASAAAITCSRTGARPPSKMELA